MSRRHYVQGDIMCNDVRVWSYCMPSLCLLGLYFLYFAADEIWQASANYVKCRLLQLLKKSASVRGFLLFDYSREMSGCIRELVQQLESGRIKSHVDNGRHSSHGPFTGLKSLVDAVEVAVGAVWGRGDVRATREGPMTLACEQHVGSLQIQSSACYQ